MKTLYATLAMLFFLSTQHLKAQNTFKLCIGGSIGTGKINITKIPINSNANEQVFSRVYDFSANARIETTKSIWHYGLSTDLLLRNFTLIDKDVTIRTPGIENTKSYFNAKAVMAFPYLKRMFNPYGLYLQTGVGGVIVFGQKFRHTTPVTDNVIQHHIYRENNRLMLFFETGYELTKKLTLNIKYQIGFTDVVRGDYLKFTDGKISSHQQFATNFSSLLLGANYTINNHTATVGRQNIYKPSLYKSSVKVENIIAVNSRDVYLSIYDDKEEDGDILTLYLNDIPQKYDAQVVVENYELKNQKKQIPLHLQGISSFLIMHSISEGRTPPNTAALIINDGISAQHLQLKSTNKTSGAILIHYTDTLNNSKTKRIEGSWISDKYIMSIKYSNENLLINHSIEDKWQKYYRLSANVYKCEDGSNTLAVFDNKTIRLDSIDGSVRIYELNPTGIWQYGMINVYIRNTGNGLLAQNQGQFFWKGYERIAVNTYYRDGKIITLLDRNKIHIKFADGTEQLLQKVIIRTE